MEEVTEGVDKEDLEQIQKAVHAADAAVVAKTQKNVQTIVQDAKIINATNNDREQKVVYAILDADSKGASIHEVRDIINEAVKPVKLVAPKKKEEIVAEDVVEEQTKSIAEEIADAIEEDKTDDLAGEIVKEIEAEKADADEKKADDDDADEKADKSGDDADKKSDDDASGSDDEAKEGEEGEEEEKELTEEEKEAAEIKRVAETESSLERLFKQMSQSTE